MVTDACYTGNIYTYNISILSPLTFSSQAENLFSANPTHRSLPFLLHDLPRIPQTVYRPTLLSISVFTF